VLCETNLSGDIISKIQEALNNAGFSPGKVDGVMGWRTTNALKAFQEKNELATGGITYETVQKLGIQF
jgi:peptidoglycan hydrolase-like protein with peptidoglycan-binding domain